LEILAYIVLDELLEKIANDISVRYVSRHASQRSSITGIAAVPFFFLDYGYEDG
jgi:hypothetical protein